jgi:hypothetical protein
VVARDGRRGHKNQWWRIEVKSTDREKGWRSPLLSSRNVKKLSKKAEILAAVSLDSKSGAVKCELVSLRELSRGQRGKPESIRRKGDVKRFLRKL